MKLNSTVAALLVAALAAGAVAFSVEQWRSSKAAQRARPAEAPAAAAQVQAQTAASTQRPAARSGWAASAPGRVEPREGEARLGSQMPGKVAQVLVRMNDTVKGGDVLVRIADDDLVAKLSAALAEASVRRRERDTENVLKPAAERRQAEDNLSFAERAHHRARLELDRLQSLAASGGAIQPGEIAAARTALGEAADKLEQERANLRRVQGLPNMPLPTRLESSLATARAELSAMEIALERTRIRAPFDGTVLQVNTRVGETVTPSPEDVLVTVGDLTSLRVRAELEERDIAKIRVGQPVVVRSDAFPGQDFQGRVERMAQGLGAPRIGPKGTRRPNEQDVLQVLIDLEGRPPLLPGMRVDVFFRPDATAGTAATKAN